MRAAPARLARIRARATAQRPAPAPQAAVDAAPRRGQAAAAALPLPPIVRRCQSRAVRQDREICGCPSSRASPEFPAPAQVAPPAARPAALLLARAE